MAQGAWILAAANQVSKLYFFYLINSEFIPDAAPPANPGAVPGQGISPPPPDSSPAALLPQPPPLPRLSLLRSSSRPSPPHPSSPHPSPRPSPPRPRPAEEQTQAPLTRSPRSLSLGGSNLRLARLESAPATARLP